MMHVFLFESGLGQNLDVLKWWMMLFLFDIKHIWTKLKTNHQNLTGKTLKTPPEKHADEQLPERKMMTHHLDRCAEQHPSRWFSKDVRFHEGSSFDLINLRRIKTSFKFLDSSKDDLSIWLLSFGESDILRTICHLSNKISILRAMIQSFDG